MSDRTDRLLGVLRGAKTRIVITGHDAPDVDSLLSCALMQRFLSRVGIDARIALMTQADAQSSRIAQRLGVDVQAMYGEIKPDNSLILLDHHRAQHGGQVLACIDHHPTDFCPDYPHTQIESAGACTYMVLQLMRDAGVAITPQDEALAVCALYLDTVALRSTKISPQEIAWAKAASARLHLDEAWLEREGLSLADLTLPPEELAMTGIKEYVYGKKRVYSTYTQTDAMTQSVLERIIAHLKSALAARGGDLWVYLVHDPRAMRTTQYDILPDGGVKETRYDFLASRAKDVMTRVEKRLMEENRG
ncbi:MAG: DHH family phosphoesterase [Clostridia bacterium]|nr:DHH family phosphoesterase [Clostridia bacterium]